MKKAEVALAKLTPEDREQFILDNQEAFNYGAMEEFGLRDDHLEDDGQIISRQTIERSIDGEGAEAWRILYEGKPAGGLILRLEPEKKRGELEILFTSPKLHGQGVGYGAWLAAEALHPEVEIWETCTPSFETRNIHFYINKCGFAAVEFFCPGHPDPHMPEEFQGGDFGGEDQGMMFRFEKRMKR